MSDSRDIPEDLEELFRLVCETQLEAAVLFRKAAEQMLAGLSASSEDYPQQPGSD